MDDIHHPHPCPPQCEICHPNAKASFATIGQWCEFPEIGLRLLVLHAGRQQVTIYSENLDTPPEKAVE